MKYKIDPKELEWDFVRSSGPGGQNVNKVATAVQLKFHISNSKGLPEDMKIRMKKIAGKRVNRDGELLIIARRHRTQMKNREDALKRLNDMIMKAGQSPRLRKKTKPSHESSLRRLDEKQKLSVKKQLRRKSFSE
jgi:ribosome-associated protein